MSNFFSELKRRNVVRMAGLYLVGAWLLTQVASTVLPMFGAPDWLPRSIVVLLVIGFVPGLIFSWVFELTPQGLKRDGEVVPEQSIGPQTGRRMDRMIIVVLLLALGYFAFDKFVLTPRRVTTDAASHPLPLPNDTNLDPKSIAVLPFENLSSDKENAYFADGIQDDILTNLAKIADLKVISRTSVAQYRGKNENVREIGRALGVATLLEGSVRKAGNRVRVNVQLINAADDHHLWAEDYDRELTDVFAIQTDLAQNIAAQLHAKLSSAEKVTLTQPPTVNGEAYLAYIQAHNLRNTWQDREKFTAAEQLYTHAIELDPKFALAIAGQSSLQSSIFHQLDASAARAQRARELADQALTLQPNLPEAHLALGYCHYYLDHDPGHYERALKEFYLAREDLPNDSDVYVAIAAIERRQGKWKESTASHEKALQLDPKSSWVLHTLAVNYWFTRNWEAANRTIDRALQLAPRDFTLWSRKWDIIFAERGDFNAGNELLEQMDRAVPEIGQSPRAIIWRASFHIQQRKWAEALRELESLPDSSIGSAPTQLRDKYDGIGQCKQALGDTNAAHAALLRAREAAERHLTEGPGDAARHTDYSETLARLGDKEAAIREGKRAVELMPESSDALDGPFRIQALAKTYTLVGEPDKAIDLLIHLLEVPSQITPWVLKASSDWDPLRGYPRFEQLCERANK